jgi:hypothetical protein
MEIDRNQTGDQVRRHIEEVRAIGRVGVRGAPRLAALGALLALVTLLGAQGPPRRWRPTGCRPACRCRRGRRASGCTSTRLNHRIPA